MQPITLLAAALSTSALIALGVRVAGLPGSVQPSPHEPGALLDRFAEVRRELDRRGARPPLGLVTAIPIEVAMAPLLETYTDATLAAVRGQPVDAGLEAWLIEELVDLVQARGEKPQSVQRDACAVVVRQRFIPYLRELQMGPRRYALAPYLVDGEPGGPGSLCIADLPPGSDLAAQAAARGMDLLVGFPNGTGVLRVR